VFPYINIGISNHPLNASKEHLHIDKAYIVCINACINKINGELTNKCQSETNSKFQKIGLSGVELDNFMHIELEIICEKVFLQTLPNSQLRKTFWIPQNTPNTEANMNKQDVEKFFNNLEIPDNIKKLIE
jgi:hypothetical protein